MHLTQKQESLISQFLRDLSRRLDPSLPEKVRERSLRQVQTRIYHELERLNNPAISDDEVLRVLRNVASTAEASPPPARETPERPTPATAATVATPAPTTTPHNPKVIWLGVCLHNAERLGIETWMLRAGLVVLGLCTGPVAVLAYIAGFGEYYMGLHEAERPAIDWPRIALRGVIALAALVALRWGANQALVLIGYGHEQIFKEPLPSLGEWDWFRFQEGTYFFLALFTVLPLAILSGLPLANAWGHSLKRLAQAMGSLYAVALCFGVASVIAGLILDRVQAYLQ
jgi:phage shock protein PspC (stress-responsive transcriptional regulator)